MYFYVHELTFLSIYVTRTIKKIAKFNILKSLFFIFYLQNETNKFNFTCHIDSYKHEGVNILWFKAVLIIGRFFLEFEDEAETHPREKRGFTVNKSSRISYLLPKISLNTH